MRDETERLLEDIQPMVDMIDDMLNAAEGKPDVDKLKAWFANIPRLQDKDEAKVKLLKTMEYITPGQTRAVLFGNRLFMASLVAIILDPDAPPVNPHILESLNKAHNILQNAINDIRANQ